MKRGALNRIALWSILALAGWGAPHAAAESAESLARKGNALYQQGKHDQAADAYRQALMRSPGNSLIKYNLGTALARTGKIPDAQKTLTEAAESPGSPRRGDAYYNLGTALAESTQKKPEDPAQPAPGQSGAPQAAAPQAASPGASGAPAAPDPVQAAEQKVALLEQSLDSFRKSILTNSQEDRPLQECKYNYETVLEMLKQARQQLEQEKQNKKDCKDGKQGKDGQNQQDGQDSKNGQDQKNQQGKKDPKNGQQGGPQQGPKPGGSQNGQQNGQQQDGKGQMTPEQLDAMGLLNMLESEKPEQFKQLYRFRGENDSQKQPTKDW